MLAALSSPDAHASPRLPGRGGLRACAAVHLLAASRPSTGIARPAARLRRAAAQRRPGSLSPARPTPFATTTRAPSLAVAATRPRSHERHGRRRRLREAHRVAPRRRRRSAARLRGGLRARVGGAELCHHVLALAATGDALLLDHLPRRPLACAPPQAARPAWQQGVGVAASRTRRLSSGAADETDAAGAHAGGHIALYGDVSGCAVLDALAGSATTAQLLPYAPLFVATAETGECMVGGSDGLLHVYSAAADGTLAEVAHASRDAVAGVTAGDVLGDAVAIGYDDGTVVVTSAAGTSEQVLLFDFPITGVRFIESDGGTLSLLVCCAAGEAVVYDDIARSGLSDGHALPGSNEHDCVTCCAVLDTRLDGRPTVLLGTHSGCVLTYDAGLSVAPTVLRLPCPVMSLLAADISGDGLDDALPDTRQRARPADRPAADPRQAAARATATAWKQHKYMNG